MPLSEVLAKHFPWCAEEVDGIRSVFKCYVERKREQAALDYDDLLLHWHALAAAPKVGDEAARRFDHILVDEYQDTNVLQAEILKGLRPSGEGLTVVGDDAQAIYSFRAATVANILEFPERHPGTEIVKLEQNYRSTEPILRASNAVIAGARRRYGKELWSGRESVAKPALTTCRDESEQSDIVCREVLGQRERGIALQRQAVLFRASHHSGPLEVELTRRNIPFVKFGGLKFLDSAHVKDMLAALRFAQNMRDRVAGFRLLQLLPGVGPAKRRALLEHFGSHAALAAAGVEDIAAVKGVSAIWGPQKACRRFPAGSLNSIPLLTPNMSRSAEDKLTTG
jgi:DNA helicase-2/ATP-dependent DNA helicase PcrA